MAPVIKISEDFQGPERIVNNTPSANATMSGDGSAAESNTVAQLANEFHYFNQFGFIKAPVTLGDGGDEKLRRFAAALCNVSGADGKVSPEELAFIMGYCASKGYPQSIVDDIPSMCREAEKKTPKQLQKETQELLTLGSLKKAKRQIVYDAIRTAEQTILSRHQKEAIAKVAEGLGVSEEEVEKIHKLVKKERALIAARAAVLFPPDAREVFPKKDRVRSLFPQRSQSFADCATHEPVPVVMISDPGQDLDDEMMFIMSSHLHSHGLIDIKGVVANLHPSFARARLTRGTLNLLGLEDVPVGIGTDGGDEEGTHSSEQFESTASSYIIGEDDEDGVRGLESGSDLLRRLYEAAPDVKYVNTYGRRPSVGVEGRDAASFGKTIAKKLVRGGLTVVATSSFKDISLFVRECPDLFAKKTREVVVMGGCVPVADSSDECKPDSANNNTFDPEASAYLYRECQRMNVTLTVVARHSAYAAKMPRTVYDDLALTGSAIGLRLRNAQRDGIDGLWRRASSDDPARRKGLPPRCDRKWFTNTFCGGKDDPGRGSDDSIWDLVTGFMQYDTLALLASIPAVRDSYFNPAVLPPLSKDKNESKGAKGAKLIAFDAGTRNLIGNTADEHNIREPSLLVQLLKTGYRQGLLCNSVVSGVSR